MSEEDWLEPRELVMELALLQVGQNATIRRVANDKYTVRFQEEMTPKQARQYEYDRFWMYTG